MIYVNFDKEGIVVMWSGYPVKNYDVILKELPKGVKGNERYYQSTKGGVKLREDLKQFKAKEEAKIEKAKKEAKKKAKEEEEKIKAAAEAAAKAEFLIYGTYKADKEKFERDSINLEKQKSKILEQETRLQSEFIRLEEEKKKIEKKQNPPKKTNKKKT